jgi:hypothetical protein
MISLSNVTLIALSGIDYQTTENVAAIKKSCEGIQWGAVKYIQLGEITDINSWNKAVVYDLWKYVETDFAMFIHGDGYVINPDCFQPSWLDYDFVGAPWPLPADSYSYRTAEGELVRVGNSVSLRSKRLMRLPTELNLEWKSYFGNTNEDGFLTVHHRKLFQDLGIKYAPLEVAKDFSKEHEIEENKGLKTFAFHSL